MDLETKQAFIEMYEHIKILRAQTNLLTVSVRAIVEIVNEDPELAARYSQAFADQEAAASTTSDSEALAQIEKDMLKMLQGTGPAN